ncbi:YceI family protein [Hymenobacter sp. HMF4947]|uniref:YceI family protein n=1 Tax=Hymenobacter ginkgonis TaxID=2682976 RepID=A0A7K1T9A1_9BACT|nr:YceI family protein [Hymenobacter ginkgonis]
MILAGLLSWLAVGPALGQTKYFTRTGTISFFSATPFEDIEARNQQVGAAVDVQSGQVAFTVPMKEFKFPKSLMQVHFNENYVESEKYPKATFTGHLVGFESVQLVSSGPRQVQVEGDLTIHGVTRHVRVPGTLEKQGNRLLVNSKFAVASADYNIEIPALVRSHVAKTVDVTVALACEPIP